MHRNDDDEFRHRERAQSREFPETLALFARVRTALAERLFRTPLSARDEREMLYTKVQALDTLTAEMTALLTAGTDAVDAYIERIRSA